MHKPGHLGVSLIVYAPILALSLATGHAIIGLIGGGLVAMSASWPDVDVKIPFIKHRGPTHTVWFAILIAWLFGGAFVPLAAVLPHSSATMLVFGAFVGFFSVCAHLAGDVITHAGIAPLAPLKKTNHSLHWTTSDSARYNYGFLFLGLLFTGFAVMIGLQIGGFPLPVA